MKPVLEHLILDTQESFRIHHAQHSAFYIPWHYHPEYEIILIKESTGTRFVGDHIEAFQPGDLVMMGPGLPHVWKNDKKFLEENPTLQAHAMVIHFSPGFYDKAFGNLPELESVKLLFKKAQRGIHFFGKTGKDLTKKMELLDKEDGAKRLLKFMDFLISMSECKESSELASAGFVNSYQSESEKRMVKVYEFIMNNFTKKIKLEEVSEIAHMAPTAFCRYFKMRTGKTYITFLNEIRLGYVRKLLMEKGCTIQMAAMEAGYQNLSNFNAHFKKLTGETPSEYMLKHTRK